MRMRIISSSVVLGLGIVGIALAQQPRQQPQDRVSERAQLRARVVKLEVDVKLLQLDQEVDGRHLKSVMVQMRTMEGFDAGVLEKDLALASEDRFGSGLGVVGLDETMARARTYIDRKRKDFARQAAELAEKRLELVDLEKRYNEAK
jgi:hypothetical protein